MRVIVLSQRSATFAEAADEDLFNPADTAVVLDRSTESLRLWRHAGIGPASFLVGRRRYYRAGVIRAWLAAQESAAE